MNRVDAEPYAPDLSNVQALVVDWDDLYAFSRGQPDNPGPKIAHHKAVAEQFGYVLEDDVLDEHWGSGLRNELPHFYGNPPDVGFEEMLAAFEALNYLYPKPLLPGARELHDIAGRLGLTRGVVTSHLTANARDEIALAGLRPADFDFIHGSDETPAIKPNPRAFELAITELSLRGIDPDRAVYLGDSLGDASAAETGMKFIGVATGRVAVEGFRQAGFYAEENLRTVGRLLLNRTTPIPDPVS